MDYYTQNVLIDWVMGSIIMRNDNVNRKKCQQLSLLRSVSKEIKTIIDENPLFERKKSAYLLSGVIDELGEEIDKCYIQEIDFFQHKYYLQYIFNNYTGIDTSYKIYKKNVHAYKLDPLDPFRNMKYIWRARFKKQMSRSIVLNMAMDHAEKKTSINFLRELAEFY
jgi:hypothetical protein